MHCGTEALDTTLQSGDRLVESDRTASDNKTYNTALILHMTLLFHFSCCLH